MPYSTLLVEKKGGIATVTLNRPHKLNTLSTKLFLELKQLMAELRCDLETRVVIICGAGRAFSGGFDFRPEELKQHFAHPELPNERIWQLFCQDLMTDIENLEQATIAAIHGPCIGGGLCIAANCDFRIAAEDARLGVPETNLGIFLSWGATPRLCALLGPPRARELIMTCELLDAQEAWRSGLVNKVVPKKKLMETSYALAEKILSRGPLAVRICKKQVNAASTARMSNLFLLESELMDRNQLSPDVGEGILAALEKRPPRFSREKSQTFEF